MCIRDRHILGSVDQPTEGKVIVEGTDISTMNRTQAAIFRRRKVGLSLIHISRSYSELFAVSHKCIIIHYDTGTGGNRRG